MELRQNPFFDHGRWYWRTENQNINGPYTTQVEALRALLRHCDTRSRWLKLKEAFREFVQS